VRTSTRLTGSGRLTGSLVIISIVAVAFVVGAAAIALDWVHQATPVVDPRTLGFLAVGVVPAVLILITPALMASTPTWSRQSAAPAHRHWQRWFWPSRPPGAADTVVNPIKFGNAKFRVVNTRFDDFTVLRWLNMMTGTPTRSWLSAAPADQHGQRRFWPSRPPAAADTVSNSGEILRISLLCPNMRAVLPRRSPAKGQPW
jgi:hypothetical protein